MAVKFDLIEFTGFDQELVYLPVFCAGVQNWIGLLNRGHSLCSHRSTDSYSRQRRAPNRRRPRPP